MGLRQFFARLLPSGCVAGTRVEFLAPFTGLCPTRAIGPPLTAVDGGCSFARIQFSPVHGASRGSALANDSSRTAGLKEPPTPPTCSENVPCRGLTSARSGLLFPWPRCWNCWVSRRVLLPGNKFGALVRCMGRKRTAGFSRPILPRIPFNASNAGRLEITSISGPPSPGNRSTRQGKKNWFATALADPYYQAVAC